MDQAPAVTEILQTTAGAMTLEELSVEIGDRTWTILHGDSAINRDDEHAFLKTQNETKRPYGMVLWPSAIALANDLATRDLTGMRILELGAGTGLPGIVAAARGARVVQTDRQKAALHVCEKNAARNRVTIEHRIADWTMWRDTDRYDFVIGSDILYEDFFHPFLRNIVDTNLAPGGTALVADPMRTQSMAFFELMESDGWRVAMDKWTVGVIGPPRTIGVFSLARVSECGTTKT